MEERKAKKQKFFEELYKLDESDEGSQEADELIMKVRGRKGNHTGFDVSEVQQQDPSLADQSSATRQMVREVMVPDSAPQKVNAVSPISPTDPARSAALLNHDQARSNKHQAIRSKDQTMAPKETTKRRGRRKKDQSPKLLPDSEQIFKDLRFYFFPNNDISPTRRFRIRKATERGALWVREWSTDVTHVIADRDLTYKDLLVYLKLQAIPPHIIVVTEDYQADCISYKLVLNPRQLRYQMEGSEVLSINNPISSTDISSNIAQTIPNSQLESSQNIATNSPSNNHQPAAIQEKPGEFKEVQKSREAEHSKQVENFGEARTSPVDNQPISAPSNVKRRNMDALDEAIEQAKVTKDLPLESDEDLQAEQHAVSDEDDSPTQNSPLSRRSQRLKKGQETFSCMNKNEGRQNLENPNQRTIVILQQMLDYYDRTKDHWRTLAYRKAISALRKQTRKVQTKEEALSIPAIGERLAAKIEEIVWTDKLKRLDYAKLEPHDKVLQLFLQIYGVGHTQASVWIQQGHRTLEDLTANASLTKNQLLGIQHYTDFSTRIPRQEVERHGDTVSRAFLAADSEIQITIGGSYRRGAASSGDVDFIITRPGSTITPLRWIFTETVLPQLQRQGYIQASLTHLSHTDSSIWRGAAVLAPCPTWRRIDFLFVPWAERGAALIYFTGNDIFNRSIRLLASTRGMRLNQHGLWRDVARGPKRKRITQGSLVEASSEERIFEILGVPYRPPEHRVC